MIEEHAVKAEPGKLDYLLNAADDRAGALGFGLGPHPPAPLRRFNRTMALEKLQWIADAVIAEEDLPGAEAGAQIEDLLLVRTAIGGARPRAVVEDDGALWLAKFNRRDDRWNSAASNRPRSVWPAPAASTWPTAGSTGPGTGTS